TSRNVSAFPNLRTVTVDLLYPIGYPRAAIWDDLNLLCPRVERVVVREHAYHPDRASDGSGSSIDGWPLVLY
ncbi:hypothetical protein FRB94_008700, partial [Tulasnella sp. JGI-2019a]